MRHKTIPTQQGHDEEESKEKNKVGKSCGVVKEERKKKEEEEDC